MKNSNQNTDAWADGYRFRLQLSGSAAQQVGHEFTKTKAEAKRRREQLRDCADIQATIFAITEDGGLNFAR